MGLFISLTLALLFSGLLLITCERIRQGIIVFWLGWTGVIVMMFMSDGVTPRTVVAAVIWLLVSAAAYAAVHARPARSTR